jgi:threonine synthase
MDVGAPSNFERLAALDPGLCEVAVELVEDKAIRARIQADYAASHYVWCPHSATASEAYERLSPEERNARPWIAAATAHPFKFADTVEPLIGTAIEPTPALRGIAGRNSRKRSIPAELGALSGALERETV